MKLKNLALSVICFASLGSLVGCQSSAGNKKSDSSAASNQKGEESGSEQHRTAGVDGESLHTIYFDFDKYNIRADQEDAAQAIAKSMKSTPSMSIQIQGHTDDRGSVEYNIALGNKRALALKHFLTAAGIKANKISTVSYGKERPAVDGQSEDAWAKNRRDEVVPTK